MDRNTDYGFSISLKQLVLEAGHQDEETPAFLKLTFIMFGTIGMYNPCAVGLKALPI
jgi:hypothetical protein